MRRRSDPNHSADRSNMGLWKGKKSEVEPSESGTPYQNSDMVDAAQPQDVLVPPEEVDGGSAFRQLFPKWTRDVPLPDLTAREERAHRHLKRIQWLMDESVPLPWSTEEKPANVGIDPIIGLVPVLGDISSAAISLAFVSRAAPVLSRYTTSRMLVNVGIDAAVGIVPVVGDLFDFGFKANTRNMAIFEDHMKRGRLARREDDKHYMCILFLVFAGFLTFLSLVGIGFIVLLVFLIMWLFTK